MRYFAGFYFILKITPFLIKLITWSLGRHDEIIHWYYSGTIFLATALTVGIAKPYKRAYMNYSDTLILSNLALIYYSFASGAHMLLSFRIILIIPISAFIIIMIIKVACFAGRSLSQCTYFKLIMEKVTSLRATIFFHKEEQRFTIDSPTEAQPLIEPTTTVLSYGTCADNKTSKNSIQ